MQTKDFFKHAKLAGSIALASSLLMAGAQVQAAPWAGTQSAAVSGYEYIQVGVSNVPFGPHSWGNAGIGISNFPLLGVSARVDFEGLTNDVSGPVYHLDFPITEAPETHDELGVFSFARAGDGDVWFGEWSENGDTAVNGTTYNGRQVYYHGDNADSDVITNNLLGTQVNYNVIGINKFAENGVMEGTFTADFGALELTGYVQNVASGIKMNIGTATIGLNTAAISGNAAVFSISGVDVATGGVVNGHFFNNQDALAGIADFGAGSDYNTAFGGQAQ
ncbi:Slam-dependent surface lipoprotein [Methylophaga lonarensis]|uniref:Slam-dependent surface lipoprotein n=1 Tax=Methylophaga lonarensis TaxID=999151 RepID=UPI003D2E5A24